MGMNQNLRPWTLGTAYLGHFRSLFTVDHPFCFEFCLEYIRASPDLQERKKPYVDVTREMVFEHERQIACNGDLAAVVAPSTVESFALTGLESHHWHSLGMFGIVWEKIGPFEYL
jgi:hypothetical protein